MSLKYIAVDGFDYELSDPTVSATVIFTGTPSVNCKAGGQGICKDGFGATVTAITTTTATIVDPGPYSVSFAATASKCKADGDLVLLVGDETDSVNATPQVPGTPPTPSPVSFKIKITDAGQDKVRGS